MENKACSIITGYGGAAMLKLTEPIGDWQDFKTVEEYILFRLPCLEIN